MRRTKLGIAGFVALGRALEGGACPQLTCLDVRWNDAMAQGVKALCAAMRGHALPLLHTLNIGVVQAGTEGVTALAEALAPPPGDCETGNKGKGMGEDERVGTELKDSGGKKKSDGGDQAHSPRGPQGSPSEPTG